MKTLRKKIPLIIRLNPTFGLFSILLSGCLSPINITEKEERKHLTVYVIGDSTAANKSPEFFPETGWAQVLDCSFDSLIMVDNRAVNGRSTKSFIEEKRWISIYNQLKEGDYVFIQFGHNDEKIEMPAVGTTIPDFKRNLEKFVHESRSKGAIPILLTPVARRTFRNGKYFDTHGEYPSAVRELSTSLGVPLIDMHKRSINLIVEFGEESSKCLFLWADAGEYEQYPNGIKDNTHFNYLGARTMAKLVVDDILELNLALGKYIQL